MVDFQAWAPSGCDGGEWEYELDVQWGEYATGGREADGISYWYVILGSNFFFKRTSAFSLSVGCGVSK